MGISYIEYPSLMSLMIMLYYLVPLFPATIRVHVVTLWKQIKGKNLLKKQLHYLENVIS
jgi:hypothetical protein